MATADLGGCEPAPTPLRREVATGQVDRSRKNWQKSAHNQCCFNDLLVHPQAFSCRLCFAFSYFFSYFLSVLKWFMAPCGPLGVFQRRPTMGTCGPISLCDRFCIKYISAAYVNTSDLKRIQKFIHFVFIAGDPGVAPTGCLVGWWHRFLLTAFCPQRYKTFDLNMTWL